MKKNKCLFLLFGCIFVMKWRIVMMKNKISTLFITICFLYAYNVLANNNGMMSTFAETDFSGMNGVIETNYVDSKNDTDDFNGIRTEIQPMHQSLASGLNGVMDVFDPNTDSIINNEIIVKKTILSPNLKHSFYFSFNSAQLASSDILKIKEYALKFENVKFHSIILNGFADPTGSDAYNLILSEKRAHSLKDILVQSGISNEVIITQGMGEESDSDDYAKSRRVEVIFVIGQ